MTIYKQVPYWVGILVSVHISPGIAQHESHDSPVFLFSHGIADTYRQAFSYYNVGIVKKPFYSFNFPDATQGITRVKRHCAVFGQHDEVARLHEAFETMRTMHTQAPYVLYGVSRGASTICNFLALERPEGVKAVILESPFATIDDVVDFLSAKKMGRLPGARGIARSLFSFIFPRYEWSGIRPLDLVDRMPKDLPILIIATTTDALVPYATSKKLYNALREAGCMVYLVTLTDGSHAKLFLSSEWDRYCAAVHAFYKRCGLPHDEEHAMRGEPLLRAQ